jgi:hypothetical protein
LAAFFLQLLTDIHLLSPLCFLLFLSALQGVEGKVVMLLLLLQLHLMTRYPTGSKMTLLLLIQLLQIRLAGVVAAVAVVMIGEGQLMFAIYVKYICLQSLESKLNLTKIFLKNYFWGHLPPTMF